MKILYAPFGFNFADDTPGVVKGALGNGINADDEQAILRVCTGLIDDANFALAATTMTHEQRLVELQANGFHLDIDETEV